MVRVPVAAPPFSFDAERLSLDFLSTLSNRGSDAAVERLPDPERLGSWLGPDRGTDCGKVAARIGRV